jgi:hypothetical protein
MWLYNFYINHFNWLSNLTRADKFIYNAPDSSPLHNVPMLIWKVIGETPFMMAVFFLIFFVGFRILAWMIGCWCGMAENIYK